MNESQNKRNLDFIKSKIESSLSSTVNSNDLNENAVIDQAKSLLKEMIPDFDDVFDDSEKREREIILKFTLNKI